MGLFDSITKAAATGLGTAYDYLTPGKGSSRLTDYGTGGNKPAAPAPKPAPSGFPTWGTGAAPDATAAATAALLAKYGVGTQAPIPRMISFDSAGSWDKARQMAENAVNPVYQAKMARFLDQQAFDLKNQQATTTQGKSALDEALSRFMADSATTRTRTSADTATDIADTTAAQAFQARGEGLSFDTANRALNESVSAAGTAESGLGRQQIADNQQARTAMSNEQVRQSDNKIEAANTLMNRTFEDLATGDTRKTADTVSGKAKLDLDMEQFIEQQGLTKANETANEEMQRQGDIVQQSGTYQGQLVDQWIQSLSGKGYTAQEIANAASIYK